MNFKKIDKTLVASIALHILVLGWGIVSFSSRRLEATPVESMPVDIISADQLSKMTAGTKSGKKENPKPLVEKVTDATPADDPVGKIAKNDIVTSTAPDPTPPPPKPVEKPIEKKPDPPKQAEKKDEPKPVDKKPEPKVDPIAEALKKDDTKKKPPPKQEAKSAPPLPTPPKPKERLFDSTKIAALIDKRDPTHQAVGGAALNPTASLGTAHGTAVALSTSEIDALRNALSDNWNIPPVDELKPNEMLVTIHFRLTRDHQLVAPPEVVSSGSSPRSLAAAEAAIRAVLKTQPFKMLRDETYDAWQDITVDFDPKMKQLRG